MSTELRSIGKYELHKHLASSNMGQLWKAYDPQLQHYVALKIFYTPQQAGSDFMTQFVHNAKRAASLHHSNIVGILDIYVFPSKNPNNSLAAMICIVTEYIEGQTLAQYMHNTPGTGKIPPGVEIVQLFTTISLALDYAHQHGMIHGNIKPTNILLNRNTPSLGRIGEPMLTDFGFTKPLRNAATTSSPFYLSPEQIKGAPASERSDIYSLGVILYELCTGVLPFRGNRPVAIMMQHINTPPTPPGFMNPTISSALANVMLRSLAKEPEARFTSASSMTIALAQAFNIPVPEALSQFAYLPDSTNGPEHNTTLSPRGTQSSVSASQPTMSRTSGPSISRPPADGPAGTAFPASIPLRSQRRGVFGQWYIIAIIALLVASLGTLGAPFLSPHNNIVAPGQVVGHAFFVNSGQLNADSPQGLNDELQTTLSHIPDPSPGKSYYAWLLADRNQSEAAPILLGRLTVNSGAVHFLYRGNQKHTNLLASVSRFLITEDDAHNPTSNPLIDTSTWRYYAEIPQLPNPGDKLHFSMLDHLRHLLVESPELQLRGLHGGLAFWLARNTATISALANSARDEWHNQDTTAIHDQMIRILDYLDGESFVHTDVPQGTPLLADPRAAQVALLGLVPQNPDPPGYVYNGEASPGYVYLINMHMNGAIQSPQTTADQRKLAIQINAGIDSVKRLLEQVHQDAKQLFSMKNAQLLQTSSLSILDDLATQVQYAYTGQLDPSTGQSSGGVLWIYGNLQRLATFNVRPFTSA